MSPLWEDQRFREIVGDTWRPGGLFCTKRALDWICAEHSLPQGSLALDLGCGAGASLALLSDYGFWALGLDCHIRVGLQNMRANALPIQGDLGQLPFKEECCQLVLLECVASLVPDPAALVRTISSLLVPGGFLVLADLTVGKGSGRSAEAVCDFSCSSGARRAAEWMELIRCAGLEICRHEVHDHELAKLWAALVWYGCTVACQTDIKKGMGYSVFIAMKGSFKGEINARIDAGNSALVP